jgi:hypothetical protein
VAFRWTPDLFTSAHEAAHVVQQRAGVQLRGGIGEVGDPFEQHADAVAERVVRGESAEHLLTSGHAPIAAVQRREAAGTSNATTPSERDLAASVHGEVHDRCVDGPRAGCFLERDDRRALKDQIGFNLLSSAENWHAALTDARLVRLCEHESGWNALWEIGFYLAMAVVSDGAIAGLGWLGSLAKSVKSIQSVAPIVNSSGEVAHAMMFAAKGLRIPFRGAVNEAANQTNNAAADFLNTLQNTPTLWAHGVHAGLGAMSDYGLILMVGVTDPHFLTFEHFAAEIGKLLDRWHHQVDEIGMSVGGGRSTSCAWIQPRTGGEPRLARVTRLLGNGGRAGMYPETFQSWIDPDMQPLALAAWEHEFPGQGIEFVTLAQLGGVTPEAIAWEQDAAHDAMSVTETAHEPERAYSHEDPR